MLERPLDWSELNVADAGCAQALNGLRDALLVSEQAEKFIRNLERAEAIPNSVMWDQHPVALRQP